MFYILVSHPDNLILGALGVISFAYLLLSQLSLRRANQHKATPATRSKTIPLPYIPFSPALSPSVLSALAWVFP